MLSILVVEDDQNIRALISTHLENHGYRVYQEDNGNLGYQRFLNHHIDVIVSDIMMPQIDGITMIKKIRELNTDIPIIMLTALEDFNSKEKSFTYGADDYMVKPIDMKELMLRIKSHLRRYQMISEQKFIHKSITLEYSKNICMIHGKPVDLTVKEFQLLFKLVSSDGKIFTREQLMNEIWGYDSESYERTVDTHIKLLRKKIDTKDIEFVTVRGLGYKVVLT